MTVPLQIFGRHPGIIDHGPDDLRHTSRKGRPRIGHAISQSVTEPDLDRQFCLLGKAHNILRKGDAKPIDIRTGHILKMASWYDPQIQGRRNNGEVFPQHHSSVLLQF